MGKKGSKRKIRWRTLSIGTPPGEKDEEEGLRNGFMGGKEHDTSTHSFNRNAQSGYKPRRSGNSDSSAYAGNSDGQKNESFGSPSQPKIIFNEDEYTRITTPRQDMLFKKGYLSRKKPWVRNVNTSATSSTTESQSASHSTADGSETTEDQQLLDRDYAIGEHATMMDSSAQLEYGTFYDHVGGYYYDYPVMLVGPAPIPTQVAPSVLAAVPCAPVSLRPMQWVNSCFVPKIPNHPYCMTNYEGNQGMENTMMMEEQENATGTVESSNGACSKSGTGSTSCSGSVAGETEEQPIEFGCAMEELQVDEQMEEQMEEQYENEEQVEEQCLENGINGGPYFEPMLLQPSVHVSHVLPAVPQPYMYPGHYMFGPPFIDVNGVTIQGGPMIRTTDVTIMSAAYAKRRRKRKRRKQILQAKSTTGNTEDEEEGECSSEYDTGLSIPNLSWTACSPSTTTTTTTTTSHQPLNPECHEFQLLKIVKPQTSLPAIPTSANNTPTSEKSSINQTSMDDKPPSDTTPVDESKEVYNGVVSDDSEDQNGEVTESSKSDIASTSTLIENSQSKLLEATPDNEASRLTHCLPVDEESVLSANKLANEATEVGKLSNTAKAVIHNDSTANELHERPSNEMNGKTLVNGKLDFDSSNNDASIASTTSMPSSPVPNNEKTRSRSITPKSVENVSICEDQNHESLTSSSKSSSSTSLSKRKYSAKGTKFVREPTPGPDLNSSAEVETETKVHELTESLEKVDLSNDTKPGSVFEPRGDKVAKDSQASNKFRIKTTCNRLSKEAIEATNEDSGFESQTQLSDYPITEAVTEWLRREKTPDLFIASAISMDCEEDEDDVDKEPPKNLHGNPMPALSVNSEADNAALSRAANCGKFARISNVNGGQEQQQLKSINNSLRRKKDVKRRLEERRRMARYALNGKVNNEGVSTSDSCDQQEDLANSARRKNPARHQQQQDVADDICEFTEKDSVVGMRVALSSRIDSKRVNARRMKRQGKSHVLRNPSNNIDTKIRCSENDENEEEIVEDTINVRTFEKGEVVVSEDGKLLMSSIFEPNLWKCQEFPAVIETPNESETVKQTTEGKTEEARTRNNSVEDKECRSRVDSWGSIEESDVLDCWESEIIESVITPKRMLQTEGILCEGEAAEDDTIEVDQVNLEYVQKYYRLARESASIEEISLKADLPTSSKTVPNMSEQKKEIATQKELAGDKNDIPIDEAFEVYESYYTGNSPFLTIGSKLFKPRTLYSQKGEEPISCKAVCCLIQ